ncbi:PREDICTED: marginal zone B- and B1-cell-specific protein [Lepidothrix coronata]|uniref:Marginal zone B- and B1-cell-specific protein n=1 Tax=Lepidothrix coronata TaxID=321398 RepID=A0A6J0IGV1_9PASS|nr:PREDICTED: marginal zone B- and B1-cell-specific protein [Lepidothrix coronata]
MDPCRQRDKMPNLSSGPIPRVTRAGRHRGYGVQELDGQKRLAGPGLPSREPVSVMVSGGPWPGRLSKMCLGYVGEQGEAQIYESHRRGPAALRELLCHGDKGPCGGGKAGAPAPRKAPQNEL